MPTGSYRSKMRDSMVAIAARIVRDEGLSAVQARRITQEAGCAVGTLYNVFGGLDLLIIEANATTLQTLGDALAEADRSLADGSISDRLLALALAYLEFANSHRREWRALFEHQLAPSATVPGWYRERQAALFGLVERILVSIIAEDSARNRAARALFSAVHGIVSISLDQKLGDYDHTEAARQVRFVVRAIANGLSALNVADIP